MRHKALAKQVVLFGCWTLIALVFASQSYLYYAATGEDKGWSRIFLWTLADWYIWALLSPLILILARRFRFEGGEWRDAIVVHTLAGVGFALVHLALQAVVQRTVGWANITGDDGSVRSLFIYLFTKKIHLDLLTYAAIVGMSHGAFYFRRYHERETEAHKLAAQTHKLEAQLVRAQLQTLQMQLHPHFLFNTLNTISELIHSETKAADSMVARLGDLLRLALETQSAQEVSLKQELEFLEKYLDIERMRFHDRLSVNLCVAPDTLDARLPNMILQPIVENAIKHGISRKPGAGTIEVSAERIDGNLQVIVRDDGTGLPAGWQQTGVREGIGLRNTRQRLEQLYSGHHHLELRDAPGGGLEVALAIPYRAHL